MAGVSDRMRKQLGLRAGLAEEPPDADASQPVQSDHRPYIYLGNTEFRQLSTISCRPFNFPRLATPCCQWSACTYPPQTIPSLVQTSQRGRLRSHRQLCAEHVWQSEWAHPRELVRLREKGTGALGESRAVETLVGSGQCEFGVFAPAVDMTATQ